jgi:hypothetical protein
MQGNGLRRKKGCKNVFLQKESGILTGQIVDLAMPRFMNWQITTHYFMPLV